MKNARQLLLAALVVAAVIVSMNITHSSASSNKFNNVIPFAEYGGLTGFFDQNDGKIYIYDGSIRKCLRVLQVDELGKEIKLVDEPKYM